LRWLLSPIKTIMCAMAIAFSFHGIILTWVPIGGAPQGKNSPLLG
jgi:hypothetical protein